MLFDDSMEITRTVADGCQTRGEMENFTKKFAVAYPSGGGAQAGPHTGMVSEPLEGCSHANKAGMSFRISEWDSETHESAQGL
jgi:hypothetical protein